MLTPHLMAGIKEAGLLARFWVNADDATALVLITQGAGKPQIVGIGWAAKDFGDNMLDLHRRADDIRRGQAIATAPARFRRYLFAQCL